MIAVLGLCALYASYLVSGSYEHRFKSQAESFDREPSPVNHAIPVIQLPTPRSDLKVANVSESHRKEPEKRRVFETREFSELTQRAWAPLPKVSAIRKDSRRDFHFAPPELLEIAEELSVISESMERDRKS